MYPSFVTQVFIGDSIALYPVIYSMLLQQSDVPACTFLLLSFVLRFSLCHPLIKLKQCKELTTVNTKTNSFSTIKSQDACRS